MSGGGELARNYDLTQSQAARKKRTFLSAIVIFIIVPLTMILASKYIGQSKYMLVSILILLYTMVPFFMVFEKRKPKAREIVLIAMMSAITVAAHMFFHITVPIQIGSALVIISGISLGPEAGFLIGALSRFVCNFYMGQGPWTPWQMFCWGLLGFLAGLVFNKVDLDELKSRNFKMVMGPILTILFAIMVAYISFLLFPSDDGSFLGWRLYVFGFVGLIGGVLVQRKRLPVDSLTMCLFTFFTVFIIYGGIMNAVGAVTSSIVPGGEILDWKGLKTLYLAGVPYDLVHGATATLCVFFFGDNIIKKLERIKIKYGIYK